MTGPQWRAERQSLKEMIERRGGRLLIVVGVAGGADARLLHHVAHGMVDRGAVPDFIGGFVCFVSGYLCAAGQGLPDLGFVLRSEIALQTDRIEQASWLAALDLQRPAFPIGVDIDTGYGNEASSVILTCRQVHKQGAQYVQIEDQADINKSCGHMAGSRGAGKMLVATDEMIARRLRPAVSFAASQADLMVMARTDALAVEGFDAAIERGRAYAEAGADMIFIEAPESADQLARIPECLEGSGALAMANMVEGGPKTPYMSPRDLHEMGYDMAIFPIGSFLAGFGAARSYLEVLCRGESPVANGAFEGGASFADVNHVMGREQTETWNTLFD